MGRHWLCGALSTATPDRWGLPLWAAGKPGLRRDSPSLPAGLSLRTAAASDGPAWPPVSTREQINDGRRNAGDGKALITEGSRLPRYEEEQHAIRGSQYAVVRGPGNRTEPERLSIL